MVFKAIITTILFASVIQAPGDELTKNLKDQESTQQEHFQEQLINDLKAYYSQLSFFDTPMLSIFASSCYANSCNKQSTSSTMHNLEQICTVVVNSAECKDVKPKEDLLDCSRLTESKSFNTLDFVIGCGKGLWNTVLDFFNFIWTIIKNAVDIPEEFMEYLESAKLYLVNEYDKAYEEAESFKTLTAVKAVAWKLGEKVFHAMQEMAQKEYKEFGCLNFEARTKKVCTILGAFVDPFVLLKTLKLGKFIYRAVTHNEKASGKTLKKARKDLNMTKKDVKGARKKNKELLSMHLENGNIEQGSVWMEYIGRNGKVKKEWIESIDNNYILTESGSKVPRRQVVSVTHSQAAAKGIAEHQKLLGFLNDNNISLDDFGHRSIEVFYDGGYPSGQLRGVHSNGVTVHDGIRRSFIHRRIITDFSHPRKVRDPLPISSEIDSRVRQFRSRFNRKSYENALYKMDSDAFISLDYNGQKRLGVIRDQQESYRERLTINLLNSESGRFDRIDVDFSDRQTLESIRVSDDAYQQIHQTYSSGKNMPMTGNSEKDLFREAFNSGTLTDDIQYIEANGQLLKITSIDKGSGTIEVELLQSIRQKEIGDVDPIFNAAPELPLQATLFSHYLDDVKISKEAKKYEAETPKKVEEEREEARIRDMTRSRSTDYDTGWHPSSHM